MKVCVLLRILTSSELLYTTKINPTMKNDLETIFKKYSSDNLLFYQNSSANNIFLQLFYSNFDNENIVEEIIDDLIPHNFFADNWLLYTLSKGLHINTIEYLSKKGFDISILDDNGENILFKIFEQTESVLISTPSSLAFCRLKDFAGSNSINKHGTL